MLFFEQLTGAHPICMDPVRTYTLVLGGAGLAYAAYALFRRKPKRPEEIERERRGWLNQVGRITDGTVIDVQEISPNGHHEASRVLSRSRKITTASKTEN